MYSTLGKKWRCLDFYVEERMNSKVLAIRIKQNYS